MATQLITPNLDPYIYVNGVPLNDWCGWCMGYVASAFQAFGAASAHDGWVNTQFKHQDKNFPAGVYVPVWFDWYGNIDGSGVKNWGHVAIYKDGNVWSSPITHKPSADEYSSLDALLQAFGGSLTYVGWSEDVNGRNVITPEGGTDMVIQDNSDWRGRANKSFQLIRGRDMGQGEFEPWIGQDFTHLIEALEDNPEADSWHADGQTGFIATRDNWPKQISDLQATVADQKAQLAASGSDTVQLNSLGVALRWLLTRLGLK